MIFRNHTVDNFDILNSQSLLGLYQLGQEVLQVIGNLLLPKGSHEQKSGHLRGSPMVDSCVDLVRIHAD